MEQTDFSGSTRPVWVDGLNIPPVSRDFPPLVDVCIVGAGIVGILSAYFLLKEGLNVLIVESGEVFGGQSGRTTAHLSYVMDEGFSHLISRFGFSFTSHYVNSHQIAINRYEELIIKEEIECDFRRCDGYLFSESLDSLLKERASCHKIGLHVGDIINSPHGLGPSLKFPQNAKLHPGRFGSSLFQRLIAMGIKIATNTRVVKVLNGRFPEVVISTGEKVSARSVIIATNSPIHHKFFIHTKQSPYRTYAIAFRIAEGFQDSMYWDDCDPYHYVRIDSSDRLLIAGGEDHKTGQSENPTECFRRLEEWVRNKFPMVKDVKSRWSGQVWEPVDGVAYLGRSPGYENVYMSTGDSGHGMTHGMIAATLNTDLIMDRPNPWAEIYDPTRKGWRSIPKYARENLNVLSQYSDYIRSNPQSDLLQLPFGSGHIFDDGIHKVAVCRDKEGLIKQFSAVCPHLGGVVHWNNAERTWDCPCHGSRFNTDGEPITGPACTPLKPWKQTIAIRKVDDEKLPPDLSAACI